MHNFKKHFGQNFLNDLNILNKIGAEVRPDLNVLEVGPGEGALTKILLKKSKSVFSVEIDKELTEKLTDLKNQHENFNFTIADFLEYSLIGQNYDIVVGNIPYYISTDIIFKIINSQVSEFILMVQKEYADRLVARVGSSEYSKLSVSVQSFFEVKRAFTVYKNCFYPVPKVDSAVVCFQAKPALVSEIQKQKYFEFLKTCFFSKRKTLFNNLLKTKIERQDILNVFKDLKINQNIRAEKLTAIEFQNLFLRLIKIKEEKWSQRLMPKSI